MVDFIQCIERQYCGLIQTHNSEYIGDVLQRLKTIAVRHNVVIVLLTKLQMPPNQLNLFGLEESSAIMQNASLVLSLCKNDDRAMLDNYYIGVYNNGKRNSYLAMQKFSMEIVKSRYSKGAGSSFELLKHFDSDFFSAETIISLLMGKA